MKNLGDRVVKVGEDWKNKINTSVENTVKRLNESNGWIGKIWQGTKNLEAPFKKVADFTKNIFENLGKAFPELKKLIDMANGLLGRGGGQQQGGTATIEGATGDQFVGAVLSILEAGNQGNNVRQSRLDVAQVIANRAGGNFAGYGGTIRDQAFASGQFQPFFKETYGIGRADIQDQESAVKALMKAGKTREQAIEALQRALALCRTVLRKSLRPMAAYLCDRLKAGQKTGRAKPKRRKRKLWLSRKSFWIRLAKLKRCFRRRGHCRLSSALARALWRILAARKPWI
jgi:hypothetical protein